MSRYPRVGQPIAPRSLREALLAIAGLAELGAESWRRYDRATCERLAAKVVAEVAHALPTLPPAVRTRLLPAPALNVPLQDLELETRTKNALRYAGVRTVADLQDWTINRALQLRNFGAKSLVDLLVTLESLHEGRGPVPVWRWRPAPEMGPLSMAEEASAVRALQEGGQLPRQLLARHLGWPTGAPDLADLGLKPRTYEALRRAGLTNAPGRLKACTVERLLAVPGLGRASLLDLFERRFRTLRAFRADRGLTRLANEVAQAPWSGKIRADDPRFARWLRQIAVPGETICSAATRVSGRTGSVSRNASIRAALLELQSRAARALDIPLEEELAGLAVAVGGERNGGLFGELRGWDGAGGATLQRVADASGLTRERVRQIAAKVEKRLAGRVPFLPVLDAALDLANQRLPISDKELTELLACEGLTKVRFSLAGLLRGLEVTGRSPPIEAVVLGTLTFLARPGWYKVADRGLAAARKLIRHWGATTTADVGELLASSEPLPDPLVRELVSANPEFRWLDEPTGWFWIPSAPRNPILARVEKVLGVAGRIRVAQLRGLIGRDYRMQGFAPPSRVLAEMCRQAGPYTVDEDLEVNAPQGRRLVRLAAGESTLVTVLRRYGPVMKREDLEEHCIELGMSRASFYQRLSYSPVLQRLAPGVYALAGASVSPGAVEALLTGRRHGKVLLDYGWESAENIWLAYRISAGMLSNGIASIPSAMRRYTEGEYPLIAADGALMGKLVVRDSAAWGMGPFFRRRGAEEGDDLLIVLHLNPRRATARLGEGGVLAQLEGTADTATHTVERVESEPGHDARVAS